MIGIIASFVTFVAGLSRFWSTIEQGFKDLLSGFFAMLEGHTIVAAIASIIVVSVISIAAGVVVERIVQQLYKDQDNAYDSAIKSVERIGRSLSK
jgi:type III secretory pathway component EscV